MVHSINCGPVKMLKFLAHVQLVMAHFGHVAIDWETLVYPTPRSIFFKCSRQIRHYSFWDSLHVRHIRNRFRAGG